MRLDVEDPRLNVRIGGLSDGRTRLVVDYPTEPRYCNAVLDALSNLIRPPRRLLEKDQNDLTHEERITRLEKRDEIRLHYLPLSCEAWAKANAVNKQYEAALENYVSAAKEASSLIGVKVEPGSEEEAYCRAVCERMEEA